jgi:Fe-S-cluster-containing dehydrogenase component
MKTWHVIIDVAQCEDCNNCLLACKDEHLDNEWPGYTLPQPRHGHRWIDIERTERGEFPLIDVAYLPVLCMHCQNAPCMKASSAVYRRDDGIVLIDPNKARGQKDLVKSCPYNMIWWNEAHNVPQKCTLCAHLLDDGWKQTRCVQACPTGALRLERLEDSEMERVIASERLETLHPELDTAPRVYYKNLYRYTACFIAGSVAVRKDGIEDCAAGARVTLSSGLQNINETFTDAFGDFRFDALEKNSGPYTVGIEFSGATRQIEVAALKNSVNLGVQYV